MDYKKAGVDIEAGYKSVELMKKHVKETMRPEVLGGLGGFAGALAATLGLITPALIITMLAAVFLKKMSGNKTVQTILCGIRPCMLGIIAAAVIFFANTSVFSAPLSNLWNNKQFGLCWQGCLIFAITFAIQWKWKPNVVWLLIGACALGAIL